MYWNSQPEAQTQPSLLVPALVIGAGGTLACWVSGNGSFENVAMILIGTLAGYLWFSYQQRQSRTKTPAAMADAMLALAMPVLVALTIVVRLVGPTWLQTLVAILSVGVLLALLVAKSAKRAGKYWGPWLPLIVWLAVRERIPWLKCR